MRGPIPEIGHRSIKVSFVEADQNARLPDGQVGRNAIPTTLNVGNNWECTFSDFKSCL